MALVSSMKGGHEPMNETKLLESLKTATGNSTDVFSQLYNDYFKNTNEKEKIEVLRLILEYPFRIGDTEDKNPLTISKEREYELVIKYESIISGVTNRMVDLNLSKEEFYEKLYKTIFASDDALYPRSEEEQIIVLKYLSEQVPDVPYFKIKRRIQISEEDFDERLEKLRPNIQEALHMFQRKFETTPESAAEIWRIVRDLTDEKDQVVLLTIILNFLQRNVKD